MWKGVGDQPGWKVYEDGELIILVSLTNLPNLNLAIRVNAEKKFIKAEQIFQNKPFGVFIESSNDQQFRISPKIETEVTEMQLLAKYVSKQKVDPKILVVKTYEQLSQWCETAGLVYNADAQELLKFMTPLYKLQGSSVFSYIEDGKVVGTGQVYVDDSNLGYIATIGVIEDYRKKGIGNKIMSACMESSKAQGAEMFALHASEMGLFLYNKLGFQPLKQWKFKIF
jgi:N-acetylglutamate synthase-like GNAT family acetyltransferase